jgi:hypothetical protein
MDIEALKERNKIARASLREQKETITSRNINKTLNNCQEEAISNIGLRYEKRTTLK